MITLHAEHAGNERHDIDPVASGSSSQEALSGVGDVGQGDGSAGQDLPDRANAPVSVVTERFLRAILTYVPLDRIVELHLFSPLRQGTTETGIAVIAADILEPDPAPEVDAAPLELSLVKDAPAADDAAETIAATVSQDDAAPNSAASADDSSETASDATIDATAAAATDATDATDTNDDWADTVLDTLAQTMAVSLADTTSDVGDDVDDDDDEDVNPYADEVDDSVAARATRHDSVAASTAENDSISASDATDDSVATSAAPDTSVAATTPAPAPAPAPVHVRHTVYTARYRLVIKGPDRGKWEIDVVNEADAPLLTVETVVRGVQRRAGEATDTVRYDAVQIARALRQLEPGTNG